MNKFRLLSSFSSGFSLIELMVVTSILILLTGGGIASFINFNEKQQLLSGAKELRDHLRTAQTLARIGETPAGCSKLSGYRVVSSDVALSKKIGLSAICEGGDIEKSSFFLPEKVSLNSDFSITFLGLHGGVEGATTIEVIGFDRTYSLEVTQGGEITQGELL